VLLIQKGRITREVEAAAMSDAAVIGEFVGFGH